MCVCVCVSEIYIRTYLSIYTYLKKPINNYKTHNYDMNEK